MRVKVITAVLASLLAIVLGAAIGGVYIPFVDVFSIIVHKVLNLELPEHIKASTVAILWNLRLPRALLAFAAGGALSVSGVVMQSIMRNSLASSYTMGVSSGASLGACLVIFYGAALPVSANFALPVMGFIFGLGTIFLALAVAQRLDWQMQNNTIILAGMVFSLFVNAITMLMSALARDHVQRLVFWQMGSFSMRGWPAVFILWPLAVLGTLFVTSLNRELDIMTFGENQAVTMGVNFKASKWTLLISAAALTGAPIAFCGIIGFVDLVAPHVVRKITGAPHRYVVPMSAAFGGAFMVICDLAARTLVPPNELPVGAITALIGAPFFAYVYFSGKSKHAGA
jgi:iron complex transport system permease protein